MPSIVQTIGQAFALATAVLVTEVARGFVEGEGMELTAPSRFA